MHPSRLEPTDSSSITSVMNNQENQTFPHPTTYNAKPVGSRSIKMEDDEAIIDLAPQSDTLVDDFLSPTPSHRNRTRSRSRQGTQRGGPLTSVSLTRLRSGSVKVTPSASSVNGKSSTLSLSHVNSSQVARGTGMGTGMLMSSRGMMLKRKRSIHQMNSQAQHQHDNDIQSPVNIKFPQDGISPFSFTANVHAIIDATSTRTNTSSWSSTSCLSAREIISLQQRCNGQDDDMNANDVPPPILKRWNLCSSKGDDKECIMTDESHLEILRRIGRNQKSKKWSSDIAPQPCSTLLDNSENQHVDVSLSSLLSMLYMMQAGLSLTHSSGNQKNDLSGSARGTTGITGCRFVLIPVSPCQGKLVRVDKEEDQGAVREIETGTTVETVDDVSSLRDHAQDSGSESESVNRKLQLEDPPSKRSRSNQVGLKSEASETVHGEEEMKMQTSESAVDPIEEVVPMATCPSSRMQSQTEGGVPMVANKTFDMKEILSSYSNCIEKNEPPPSSFVHNEFCVAIQTVWKNGSESGFASKVLKLLRGSISVSREGEGILHQKDRVRLLMSKAELLKVLRNRSKSTRIISTQIQMQTQTNDDIEDEEDSDITANEDNKYLRLILLQVLIRLELFALYHGNDNTNTRKSFQVNSDDLLTMFTKMNMESRVKKKKKKKRKQMEAEMDLHLTMQDFVGDICSIAELVTFELRAQESFVTFMKEKVLTIYASRASNLTSKIASFFELDTNMLEEDEISASSSVDLDGKLDDSKNKEKGANAPIEHPLSRWRSISPSSDAPDSTTASPIKTENPNDEVVKVIPQAEEELLFQNKRIFSVKSNRHNPLLADKGRYVGRQVSNNFLREVKVKKPAVIKRVTRPSPTIGVSKKVPVVHKAASDARPYRPRSLGSAASSFKQPRREKAPKSSKSHKDGAQKGKNKHPHAAVMAALAHMRRRK